MSCQDLAREIFDFVQVHPAKVTSLRILEERYLIRFLPKDGLASMEISGRLSQVFYWVRQIRAGHEDLSDDTWTGRTCQINLDIILAHKLELELDPHPAIRKLALSLGVSGQTVMNHLHHNLRMKYYHLRCIPHLLDDSQKTERMRWARIMLEALDVPVRTNYQYLITGDKPWMMDDL